MYDLDHVCGLYLVCDLDLVCVTLTSGEVVERVMHGEVDTMTLDERPGEYCTTKCHVRERPYLAKAILLKMGAIVVFGTVYIK